MKRLFVALVAGAVLIGVAAPQATGQEVPKLEERVEIADRYTLKEFARDLAAFKADLAIAESTILVSSSEESWRNKECRFQSLEGGTWTEREESLTAACVVKRWSVPGGLDQLMAVGNCESGWRRLADENRPYVGIFQHHRPSWNFRVASWNPDGWDTSLSTKWQNSRSQIVVTARMARADGDWDQWAGCA